MLRQGLIISKKAVARMFNRRCGATIHAWSRVVIFALALLLAAPSAMAYPNRWNIGAGMGDVELLYGRFGDHEIYVSCHPPDNSVSMSIGLVAPAAERRGPRAGIMVVTLANRELRLAGRIEEGRVEVEISGSRFLNGNGQELIRTTVDPTRTLHSLYVDGERRAEIDQFTELLTSNAGAPLTIQIEGEPRVYRLGANARVRSARSIREACPPGRRTS